MTARLALLRHGRTAWNDAGRIQGRTDIPLTPAAREELRSRHLPDKWQAARLYSSPLQRARDSAELLTGKTPEICDNLQEMDWGDWEGLRGVELRARPNSGYADIEDWGWDFCPPQGESPQTIRDRLEPWMQTLRGDCLAVTHIGVMRTALAIAWGWNFCGPCPFAIKRNRLYVINRTTDGWQAQPDPVKLGQNTS